MSEISSKHFGPIRDDYAFFLQHSTEAEADLRAYAPHLQGLFMGDEPSGCLTLAVVTVGSPRRF
jgi:hypothetical protein